MDLYNELKNIITKNNQKYQGLLDKIEETENNQTNNKETIDLEVSKLRQKKWQLTHDYATELSDIVIQNIPSLKKSDVELFDLVPYHVYAKIPAKTQITIKIIHEKGSK